MPAVEKTGAGFEQAIRSDFGRCVAALTRRLGAARLELIEDALQEAIADALARRNTDGVPAETTGWIVRVAYNKAIDVLRREARLTALGKEYHQAIAKPPEPALDDELILTFLCCHPTLPRAAQLALTLKIAYGFTVPQIARAFVSDDRTIAQRIVRAKRVLRQERARFELPERRELPTRLDSILDVLYLVFNEGYNPTDTDLTLKADLCAGSLRLVRLLAQLPSGAPPSAEALRALLCFQAAKAASRIADDGSLLLLHEQDRTRWDGALIAEGFACLERAARGDQLSRFHLEAGIAACHAAASSFHTTDWPQVVSLYDALRAVAPSPIVEVNRALAVAMASGAMAGIDELDAIPERDLLSRYPYALAAYADLYVSLGRLSEARDYLACALEHQSSRAQRALLERKLASLVREGEEKEPKGCTPSRRIKLDSRE